MTEETPMREHPNLATALAAFQLNPPQVARTSTADVQSAKGSYKYQYATLYDVQQAALPLLAAEGLAWMARLDTDFESNVMFVEWALVHGASDERITGKMPVGRVGDRWQDIGSGETYALRYAFTAATGVAPGGDDDDAQGGATAGRQATRPEPVKEYLPAGLYDLASVVTRKDAEQMFYRARGAAHLNLIVQLPSGDEMPFGSWLRAAGTDLSEPEAQPVAEARDAKVAEVVQEAADASESADEDAAAIAAHEAELAAAEARSAAQTAKAPQADEDAPEGDR